MVSYNIPLNKVVTHEYYELNVNEGGGPSVQNDHIIILLIAVVATGSIITNITIIAFFSCSESNRSLNMGLPLHSLKKEKNSTRGKLSRPPKKTEYRHQTLQYVPLILTHFNCEGTRNLDIYRQIYMYVKAAMPSGYWLFAHLSCLK